jgi:alkanesulfonate monooxygenase SsuD/methylene tetrahydromethanopterin reductase-like flavin-dependent oxidoreductase (luciferase family)
MKVGLTLPSFTEDPEVPLRVAAAAEAAGVDGIFVYDHLFRTTPSGQLRPAIE